MANISRRAGELEADKLGMEMIMAAGFDPQEVFLSHWTLDFSLDYKHHHDQALKFWEIVAAVHPDGPSFFWDHPHPHHRLLQS